MYLSEAQVNDRIGTFWKGGPSCPEFPRLLPSLIVDKHSSCLLRETTNCTLLLLSCTFATPYLTFTTSLLLRSRKLNSAFDITSLPRSTFDTERACKSPGRKSKKTQQKLTMEKERTSGEVERPEQSAPMLPVVNPATEKPEPPKSSIPAAVYIA